jgi:hypothetical protein
MKYLIPLLLLCSGCTATKLHMITISPDNCITHDHTMYRISLGQKVDCDVKTPDGWAVIYRNDGGSQITSAAVEGAVRGIVSSREIK